MSAGENQIDDRSISVNGVKMDGLCNCNDDGYGGKYWCTNCDGVGYVTTDEGDSLLAFIRRHITISSMRMKNRE